MRHLRFRMPSDVPLDQIDRDFIQGMINRMCFGFYNYGHMRRDHDRPDNIKNMRIRIKKYLETGNTEFLMDTGNYAMMEFAKPSHKKAHFRATTSEESPGSSVAGRMIRSKSELKPAHRVRQSKEGD